MGLCVSIARDQKASDLKINGDAMEGAVSHWQFLFPINHLGFTTLYLAISHPFAHLLCVQILYG